MNDDAAMMKTAVSVWLRSAPRGAPEGLTQTVGNLLDNALGCAHRYGEPDLAACLMILALSRYERADGLAACLRALRHALAELQSICRWWRA